MPTPGGGGAPGNMGAFKLHMVRMLGSTNKRNRRLPDILYALCGLAVMSDPRQETRFYNWSSLIQQDASLTVAKVFPPSQIASWQLMCQSGHIRPRARKRGMGSLRHYKKPSRHECSAPLLCTIA